jgi:hypothetical protein
MAIGDDAIAAGMDVVLGTELASTIDTEINLTRDYIAQRTPDLEAADIPITSSTGADVQASVDFLDYVKISNIGRPTNKIELLWSGGRLRVLIDGIDQGGVVLT